MPSEGKKDKRESSKGFVGKVVEFFLNAGFWLFVSLILSIAIELFGIGFDWWDLKGRQHSEQMFVLELEYLNTDFKRSVLVQSPGQWAQEFSDSVYHTMLISTGLASRMLRLEAGVGSPMMVSNYQAGKEYIHATLNIVQMFALRICVLFFSMPAFVLFALVGLQDGLVQRDLRRWGGGIESSFVYHHAKKAVGPALVLTWLIYLSNPWSMNPAFLVIPMAGLFGLSVRVTIASFKKYL
jgi:integrating conjugative element membrane protein (TIGR03747 family)